MSTKSKRHTHRYYRVRMDNNAFIWTCAEPDCMHHMPKHYEPMLLGKSFFCFECGSQDILRGEHLKLNPQYFMADDEFPSRPRCIKCVLPKGVSNGNPKS